MPTWPTSKWAGAPALVLRAAWYASIPLSVAICRAIIDLPDQKLFDIITEAPNKHLPSHQTKLTKYLRND